MYFRPTHRLVKEVFFHRRAACGVTVAYAYHTFMIHVYTYMYIENKKRIVQEGTFLKFITIIFMSCTQHATPTSRSTRYMEMLLHSGLLPIKTER